MNTYLKFAILIWTLLGSIFFSNSLRAQTHIVMAGFQVNNIRYQTRNLEQNAPTTTLDGPRRQGGPGAGIMYAYLFKSRIGGYAHLAYSSTWGSQEAFQFSPGYDTNRDRDFQGEFRSHSGESMFQISSGIIVRALEVNSWRFHANLGSGVNLHDAEYEGDLQYTHLLSETTFEHRTYGNVRKVNPASKPWFLQGGLDALWFNGKNFYFGAGLQIQQFLGTIYRTERLFIVDGGGTENIFSYDDTGIGWNFQVKAAFSW